MKRLLIDMDGVLTDIHKAFALHHKVPMTWKTIGDYRLCANMDIESGTQWNGITYQFWSEMPKLAEADDIIKLATQIYGLDQICVTTIYPTKYDFPKQKIADCLLGKQEWIEKNFPQLLNHFSLTTSKHFAAGPDVTLLDDSDENCDQFCAWGGNAIVVPAVWNKAHQHRHRIIPYLKELLLGD